MEATEPYDRVVPFMDGVFGDSELPNLEAEIAAFAQKCYLREDLKNGRNELEPHPVA